MQGKGWAGRASRQEGRQSSQRLLVGQAALVLGCGMGLCTEAQRFPLLGTV